MTSLDDRKIHAERGPGTLRQLSRFALLLEHVKVRVVTETDFAGNGDVGVGPVLGEWGVRNAPDPLGDVRMDDLSRFLGDFDYTICKCGIAGEG